MRNAPILWSFRRCPYAMRARLALKLTGARVELREILLREKPDAFLAASPSATVPCLVLDDQVIDESLDIMLWALRRNDPLGLLAMPDEGWRLIEVNDGEFKAALDRTKYANRYPEADTESERRKASATLEALQVRLSGQAWLFGARPSLADYAILPFIRQFAFIDRSWFDQQAWPDVRAWLDRFLESPEFVSIMTKYKPWVPGDEPIWFD